MNNKTNPLKFLWVLLGFLSLALGTIGIVLPILPTVPFYMATVFCFAKAQKGFIPGLHQPDFTKSILKVLFRKGQ